ncbi:hypothetical protein ACE1SV_24080 [Streptomyces sp. E-15]
MGIRFDSGTVAYDGNVVLDALDLTVEPGEVMALLGPSGSGKTTALRAVAGFVRPASGRVYLGGEDVTDLPPYPPRLRRRRRGRSARRRRPRGRPHPKVLVIGLDGVLLSRIKDAGAPYLHALMAAGLTAPSSIYADPLAPTLSGPGWSTTITGVWPDRHNVKDNSFIDSRFTRYPDFLTRAETAKPDLSTYAVASRAPITDTVFSAQVDTRVSTPSAEYDTGTTARAVARLRDADPDAVFVHLDNIDHAGHTHGAASRQYLDAIRGADAQVGQFVAAVRARPGHSVEDWLIMVTADHGHTDAGGHGGSTLQERQTFLIATGSTPAPGSVRHDVKMPDVAASALAHLGVPLDPAWGLDGRPVQQPAPDDFDALRGALGTRVDETGIPAATVGFTHTPPPGWSVDNSAMGGGGVAGWRGRSFTTDEFRTQGPARPEPRVQHPCPERLRGRRRRRVERQGGHRHLRLHPGQPRLPGHRRRHGRADVHHPLPARGPAEGRGPRLLRRRDPGERADVHRRRALAHRDRHPPGARGRHQRPGPVPVHRWQQLVPGGRRGRFRPVLTRLGASARRCSGAPSDRTNARRRRACQTASPSSRGSPTWTAS